MKTCSILFLVLISWSVAGQPVDLSTPRKAVATCLGDLSDSSFHSSLAQNLISADMVKSGKRREKLVDQLYRFLKGRGVQINLEDIPDEANFQDTLRQSRYIYILSYRFPSVYLEKTGNQWLFSSETVEAIPRLYSQAFPLGIDWLINLLPKQSRREFFGLQLWQYPAILLLITFIFLIIRLLSWLIRGAFTKILFRFGYQHLALTYVRPIARPLGLMIAMIITNIVLPLLQLPLNLAHILNIGVEALIPLFGTIAAYRGMDIIALYFKKLSDKTESTLDDQLVPLFRKALKTFVVAIGGIYVLQNLSIDILPLLGVLSIGGLAFALAAQDTVKNFFGSLMIFIDKPFQIGQWISSVGGIEGTVEEVGLRSTRIRTFSNSVIYVPNGKLADATINNYGLRNYRRFNTTITINYDTPPDLIELFIDGLKKIILEHPNSRKDFYHVYMNNLGAHSLDILFYMFFEAEDWGHELRYRHEVIMRIIRLAHTSGIQFAFPTQTLHVEDFPGQLSLAPKYAEKEKVIKEMERFFNSSDKDD